MILMDVMHNGKMHLGVHCLGQILCKMDLPNVI